MNPATITVPRIVGRRINGNTITPEGAVVMFRRRAEQITGQAHQAGRDRNLKAATGLISIAAELRDAADTLEAQL